MIIEQLQMHSLLHLPIIIFTKQIYFNPKYKIIYIDSKLPYVLTILLKKNLLMVLLWLHIMSLLFIRNFQTYCRYRICQISIAKTILSKAQSHHSSKVFSNKIHKDKNSKQRMIGWVVKLLEYISLKMLYTFLIGFLRKLANRGEKMAIY